MKRINNKDIKIEFILITIFVVLSFSLFFLLDSRKNRNQQQHLQLITKRYELAYNTIYSQHKRLAEALYSGIIKRFGIEELYKELLIADEIQKNRIRKELSSRIMERYKILQDAIQLRQLHFHLRDNESFLRFHLPERFGDDLTGVRKTVEYVNREHAPIDGFEEGRANNSYRFVFPVTAEDQSHLGSMEISFGPEAFTSAMMKQYAVLSNFFVSGTFVEDIVFPEEKEKHYEKSRYFSNYYLDRNVLAELKNVSRTEFENLPPHKNTADQIFTNATSGVAASIYDSSLDMVFTTIPVLNPLTGELGAFFTVRSKSNYFLNEAGHLKIVFVMGLFLLGMVLFTFYLQHSKRRVLESTMALLQQERDMFIQGPVMTFTWMNDKNWPVKQVSKNVLDILGYRAEEFLAGSVVYVSLIHPDDLQQVTDEVSRNSGPEVSSFIHEPYRLLNRNGESVWILGSTTLVRNSKGEVSHYLGYLVDISSSILMEKEILETRDRLELVIDGARLGTWDWNIGTGEVIFNERWAKILGYSLKEIRPHLSTWDERVHPEEWDGVNRLLMEHLEGHTPVYVAEYRLLHKSGKWIWVLAVGRVFERDEEGNALRAVGIHLDITEQKEAAFQLIVAKEAAESASHAKSVFLSNMSHELRTPLNAILGYAQVFAGDSNLSPEQQSGIRTIHQSGEHLLMLINDILDLSKIEAGRMKLVPTEFRLYEFLQGVADIIRGRMVRKGLKFLYEPESTLPIVIEADELRLRQVLLNLLSNAVKFTGNGQCVFRVQSQLSEGSRILLTMEVEDTGVGIAPEAVDDIFEPFHQTGDRLQYFEGSGLGLAISRRLVHLMGGELQLLSPVNEQPAAGEGPGSRFRFTVEFRIAAKVSSNDKINHVADQNVLNREFLKDALEFVGCAIDETLIVPPQAFLEKLAKLIRIGDMTGVVTQAEELVTVESGKYQPFAGKIEQMAEEMQLTELEAFVSMYNEASLSV